MTELQANLLTQLYNARASWPASWLIDNSPLATRRHTAAPNGNNGGGDWRRKTIGSILAGLRKKGYVSIDREWPKTWTITEKGRDFIEDNQP